MYESQTKGKWTTQRGASLLLASVIIARSTSYLLSKIGLQEMGPFTLIGLRFLVAFVFLVLCFGKRLFRIDISTLLRGLALGMVFFAVMTAELMGLRSTDSMVVSFLENTAIVFVPLIEAILRRRFPKPVVLISCMLALGGVAFLTLRRNGFYLQQGEFLCLLAALLYAVAIILTDRLSRRSDPLMLGVLQVGTMGALGMLFALVFETPRLPQNGTEWFVILSLAVVCSGFGFTLQPVAQRYLTAERAGLFCALNPLTAVILGSVFLDERLNTRGMLGTALILLSIILSSLWTKPLESVHE